MDFNSCMVRLRRHEGAQRQGDGHTFQFLYGTIKTSQSDFRTIKDPFFQFLYGTIKTTYIYTHMIGSLIFQFLYGTIKTR